MALDAIMMVMMAVYAVVVVTGTLGECTAGELRGRTSSLHAGITSYVVLTQAIVTHNRMHGRTGALAKQGTFDVYPGPGNATLQYSACSGGHTPDCCAWISDTMGNHGYPLV